jgi:hypothetical protein
VREELPAIARYVLDLDRNEFAPGGFGQEPAPFFSRRVGDAGQFICQPLA